jgi:membrane-bound metal-dependent hydrolase YbcI (DUF457 family)
MGATHALSGLALFLALVAFVPDFVQWAGWTTPAVIALGALVVSGAALIPDLDNSVSTAKNSLGFLGYGLSIFFRESSRFMQMLFRTRRDDPTPDPHRGFWHTIPAALILGGLTWLATGITKVVTLPFVGEVTIGWLGALVIAYISIQLSFAGLFSKIIKKVLKGSKSFEAISVGVAILATVVIFWGIPHDQSFWWLSVAVTVGVLTHILGDAFTTAGVPLLFPLSAVLKGKFWWTTRFLPIKAGGTVENYVFVPLFALVTVVSLFWILAGPALTK